MDEPLCRRRLLAVGATSVATATAGCTTDASAILGGDRGDRSGDDTSHDGPINRPPEDPPLRFKREDGSTITTDGLPAYTEWSVSDDSDWDLLNHDETSLITADVTLSALTVTLTNVKLNRDITIAADYLQQDGTIETTEKYTISPDSEAYQTYEQYIPINGDAFPHRKRGYIKIYFTDSHQGDNAKYLLNDHQFVAIPYQNSNGSGIHILDDESINHAVSARHGHDRIMPDSLYTETITTDTETTRFFALTHPTRDFNLYGAYSNIPHDEVNTNSNNHRNGRYRESDGNPLTYAYNAEDFEYFTTLSESFSETLDANGITDRFERIQQLAYLIGAMSYYTDNKLDSPATVLHRGTGNCTEMTYLYMGLLNTTPFDNTRCAAISCRLPSGGHAVGGIDERDLGNYPQDGSIRWVEPDEYMLNRGSPNTRYAIIELTAPREIGQWDPANTIEHIAATTELYANKDLRTF